MKTKKLHRAWGSSKPQSRKGVVRALDAAVSKWVRAEVKWCVLCGSSNRLQCGHLFGRIAYSTRWDKRNVYTLCAKCNIRMTQDAELAARLMDYARDQWGKETIDQLHTQYETPRKYTTPELVELLGEWKAMIAAQGIF